MDANQNSVFRLVERIMPSGSLEADGNNGGQRDYSLFPKNAIDAFAVAASLVERSGAYQWVIAPSTVRGQMFDDNFALAELRDEPWTTIAKAWSAVLHPAVQRDTPQWNDFQKVLIETHGQDEARILVDFVYDRHGMKPLLALWTDLVDVHAAAPLVAKDGAEQSWWRSAVRLMVVADMAARGVGFRWPMQRTANGKRGTVLQLRVLQIAADRQDSGESAPDYVTTITSPSVDASMCAVLPKTRTSGLGCTLRSLTHNLSLLPSPGIVQARWRIPGVPAPRAITGQAGEPQQDEDGYRTSFNLLLVPFPYRFSSRCFVPHDGAAAAMEAARADAAEQAFANQWAFFDVEQKWLYSDGEVRGKNDRNSAAVRTMHTELSEFVSALRKRGQDDLGAIHAVVFPELSLDANHFEKISEHLFGQAEGKDLEFVIAGLSESPVSSKNKSHVAGNFAVVRGPPEGNAANGSREWRYNEARQKHHRWKLDRSQIERYGLSDQLDPSAKWWEGIQLSRRDIDFFEPRAGTSMTVMICEDLARADPVQTVIRSIGPNLVIALLMDGPQRRGRWPSNYAGVLADDPGCAVLTFSSLALIHRASASDADPSRTIAFFKNSAGNVRELNLPIGFHALALRLCAHKKTETTLDGRPDGNSAYVWELRDVTPVRAPSKAALDWIVYGS